MTTANGQTPAPFMQNAPAVISTLGTDAHQGLTSEQAAHNLNQYGPNAFTKPKPESMLSRIVKTAADPMLIMLMIAAAITLGVNITRAMAGGHADILECVGIFFAIALSVTITVVMEGRSAKAFEALNDINDDTTVTVVRDGEVTLVSQRDITIGDVLQISTGDKLPADARLIESNDLTADESALTGESAPSAKATDAVFTDPKTPVADRTNMLYSGCFVTAGNGRAVVTAVGDDTEFGKIARELRAANTGMTPLQEKLAKLGKVIAVVGSIVAALVFVLQVARFVASGTASFDTISEAFITSITLIVAAVPEGLPTIVAACLAVNIIKMSKQNALVKKMVACETIGCINVICSDKTGTLTQNRMTVIEAYNAPGRALEKPEQIRNRMLLENFCVNGTADVTFPGATEAEAGAMPEFIGNPTECALLVAAHKAGLDYRIRRERATVLHTYPFSSETKSMTTVVRDGDGITVFAKGSPEKMLDLCAVDAKTRGEIEREIAKFQAQSCRVLGFAHRHISDKDADTAALDYAADRAGLESGMMFDGFVAIVDPLREDVPGAVERCRKAGIELKMLTGDNIVTATAIANELGILDERHIAVEARQIEEMSDEELSREIGRIRVIARSTPVIKMRVVNALKSPGQCGGGDRRRHQRRARHQERGRGHRHGHRRHRGVQGSQRYRDAGRFLCHHCQGRALGPWHLREFPAIHPVPAHREPVFGGRGTRLAVQWSGRAVHRIAAAVGQHHHGWPTRADARYGADSRQSYGPQAHPPRRRHRLARHAGAHHRLRRVHRRGVHGAKLDELHGRHRRTAVDHSVHAVRGIPAVQRLQQPRAGQRQPVRQSAAQ